MTAVASLAPCRAMARGTGPSRRSNRPSSRALGNSALNTRGIARGERGTRGKSSRVASRATSNEDDEPPAPEPLLVIVEVDGVLCDVHCDLHRLAFNEAFVELGMEGASWSEERYLSLLRTGGGTAEGMVERYFHFYGYPTPELRDPTAHIPDEVGQAAMSGSMRPEGWNAEGASVAAQAAAIQAAASRNPLNRELLARRRLEWIDEVVAKKDERLRAIVSEGRLKLRKGALDFIDECLLEDGAQVVFVGATASAPEEGVLDAVLEAIGPLRAAAVTQCGGHEQIDGCEFQSFENYHANNIVKDITANGEVAAREEQLQAVNGDVDVRKEMQAMMKQRKGELLAEEIGGDAGQAATCVDALDHRCEVADTAGGARVLDEDPEGVGGLDVRPRIADDHLDPERLGAGGDDRDRLGVAVGVDEEHVGLDVTRPAHHRHGLGRCGALVEERGVGQLHAGQVAHHRLVVEERLEPPLGDRHRLHPWALAKHFCDDRLIFHGVQGTGGDHHVSSWAHQTGRATGDVHLQAVEVTA